MQNNKYSWMTHKSSYFILGEGSWSNEPPWDGLALPTKLHKIEKDMPAQKKDMLRVLLLLEVAKIFNQG
jgi:hypothetical protein